MTTATIVLMVLTIVLAGQSVAAAEQTFTFSGRGTAHGVGLDMAGVKALADQGRGHEDILRTYYSGVSFTGGRENEILRVGIVAVQNEFKITADGAYHVYPNNTGPGARVNRDVVTHVTYENGQYVTRIEGVGTWTSPGFTRVEPVGDSHLRIFNHKYVSPKHTGWERYRGHFEARRASNGELWFIEVVDIEGYLKGLAEEPKEWPTEGQRALAVAGRTYALYKKSTSTRWDYANFDISATGGEQHYRGYDAEIGNASLSAAVDNTRGKVIVYNGQLIVAAYHGNSGGHTESMENVWGGSAYPYLKGVPSPWTPIYYWQTKLTKQEVENRINRGFAAVGETGGTLYGLDLSDKTASGRVHNIKISGSYGTRTRLAFDVLHNWLGLSSALVDKLVITGSDDWDEFILLANPNAQPAKTRITFIFPDRSRKTVIRTVRPHARRTIAVDRLVKAGPVSARIGSDIPIVAERSVYFANGTEGGGHNSIGLRSASRRWYFAEGRTGRRFDTYLIVTNPTSSPAVVTATFMPGKGRRIRKRLTVGAYARREILVDGVPGLASAGTPAVVRSRKPVVVERVTYFDKDGVIGGHGGAGSRRLSNTWYFAEGFTGSGSKNRLMIFNPSGAATRARVTLNKADGAEVARDFAIPARSRRSILLNNMLSGIEFGIKVTAESGVVAERTSYFGTGAHSSIGSPMASNTWYFAEGNTGSGFEELLTLLNLTANRANVTIEYLAEGGGVAATRVHSLGPNSRKTITVGDTSELGAGQAVAIKVTADEEIVAERVMYFSYSGNRGQSTWTGGHASIGTPRPSRRWFFAEGNNQ